MLVFDFVWCGVKVFVYATTGLGRCDSYVDVVCVDRGARILQECLA